MRLMVTGASGFVGNAIVNRSIANSSWHLRAAARGRLAEVPDGVELVRVGDLAGDTDWRSAVAGVDAVVHAAARVHVMRDSAANPETEFRKANVDGTINLARQAVKAGVKRFVFISSIKVNGEYTLPGRPYTADDIPAPADFYGISKKEAELGLTQLAHETGLEVVIIRPVLVYGPGVKANFRSMMHWLYRGIPLPLGALRNKRSFVSLDNLTDLVMACLSHPAAANQVFLASDGEDLSTPALLRRMAVALGRPVRLFPISPLILRGVARIARRADFAQRLCCSLQVDIAKNKRVLGWAPPASLDEGLKQTARRFLADLSR